MEDYGGEFLGGRVDVYFFEDVHFWCGGLVWVWFGAMVRWEWCAGMKYVMLKWFVWLWDVFTVGERNGDAVRSG